jgi:hypothetical protein
MPSHFMNEILMWKKAILAVLRLLLVVGSGVWLKRIDLI